MTLAKAKSGIFLLIMLSMTPYLFGAGVPEEEFDCRSKKPPCGWLWGAMHEELGYFSVSRTRENDLGGEYLRGVTVGHGVTGDSLTKFGRFSAGLWLSGQKAENLEIFGIGIDLSIPRFALGPARIAPRFQAGLEYRTSDPHQGLASLLSVGGEFGLWIGRRVQVAVTADREFNLPGGTSNRVGFVFRIHALGNLFD